MNSNQSVQPNDPKKRLVNEIIKMNNAAVECMIVEKIPSQASEILLRALSMSMKICSGLQKLKSESPEDSKKIEGLLLNSLLGKANNKTYGSLQACKMRDSIAKSEIVEYDEGMNVYPNPLQVQDLADLDLPSVFVDLLYNLGQINMHRGEDDTAL